MRIGIYNLCWRFANWLRRAVGRPALAKRCCRNPKNLKAVNLRPGLAMNVCRECGCRHFEAVADPVLLGVFFPSKPQV
jgi:hypothetical protein